MTSSPALEGTQGEQAVPPPCSQPCTAASTSQPGESPGAGILALATHLSCPCRCSASNRAARPSYVHIRALLAARRGHHDSKQGAMGPVPQKCGAGGCSRCGSQHPARLGQAHRRYSGGRETPLVANVPISSTWEWGSGGPCLGDVLHL